MRKHRLGRPALSGLIALAASLVLVRPDPNPFGIAINIEVPWNEGDQQGGGYGHSADVIAKLHEACERSIEEQVAG